MLTMHRPANVDEAEKLKCTMNEIVGNVHDLPVIFPIHPRTAKLFAGQWKKGGIPELWDGKAAERIVEILTKQIV